MIFRRISYWLAAQFTVFVFALLLVTGSVYFAGDLLQRHGETRARLERQMMQILERPSGSRAVFLLPPFQRERIRVTDALGQPVHSGTLYDDIPFSPRRGITTVERGNESYDILTSPLFQDGQIVGYLQVADRSPPNVLSTRALMFILVSVLISGFTFIVGLLFARRSLKPAEQMMQRLEQFTQDASHELRTPLTAVSTSLDLALADPGDITHITEAKKGLKDVTTLVERLLDLARLDAFALTKESVDISALTNAVLDVHEAHAQRMNVHIDRRIAEAVHVSADPALLRQLVANLLSNAIKFNRKGGTVTVTLTKNSLTVSDTGSGIAAAALSHIFDRFYREDTARSNAADGLGLGLALTKRIVDLHNWSITVESTQGSGSTFTVTF